MNGFLMLFGRDCRNLAPEKNFESKKSVEPTYYEHSQSAEVDGLIIANLHSSLHRRSGVVI